MEYINIFTTIYLTKHIIPFDLKYLVCQSYVQVLQSY